MKSKKIPGNLIVVVLLAVSIALASGQDRYTLKVPNGLAFSEFRGYESWQVVSISQNGSLLAVTLANPVMIKAYQDGAPDNGKPIPDGAKMAKVHWNPKKMQTFPAATVPGTVHDVDFMVKDSKRFADSAGWGCPRSSMRLHPIPLGPPTCLTSRRRETTSNAGSPATRSSRQEITFSRSMRNGELRVIGLI